MPMIDVYAPTDLFPDGVDREIAEGLTLALLRAEGVQHPAAVQLNNTAAYIHRLNPKAVHTAGAASCQADGSDSGADASWGIEQGGPAQLRR